MVNITLQAEGGRISDGIIQGISLINPTITSGLLSNKYHPGGKIDFSEGGNAQNYTTQGWSFPEKNYTWTQKHIASLNLSLDQIPAPAFLSIQASAFAGPGLTSQRVRISINNHEIPGELRFNSSVQPQIIPIPTGILTNGTNIVSFALPDATSPALLNISNDGRNLGLAMRSISITSTEPGLQKLKTQKNLEIASFFEKNRADVSSHPGIKQKTGFEILPYIKSQYSGLLLFHQTPLLNRIWGPEQVQKIFRVRDTIQNTLKNLIDLPIPATSKAHLCRGIHSSNVEYDTIYYDPKADNVRRNYSDQDLIIANSNLNNLSEELQPYNISLMYLIPPDTSHVYENIFVNVPEPKASRMYSDIRNISKRYQYIDAEGLIKDRVQTGELDLYPIFTRHWAPKTGSYIAGEIVRIIQKNTM